MLYEYEDPRGSIDRDNERAERECEDHKVKEIVQGEETGEGDKDPGEDMVGDPNEPQVTE